nr:hypothetical protein [uncultured Desulfobulbus sp.]
MEGSELTSNLVKINDIINVYNSYITLLAQLKKDSGNLAIVFHDPGQKRIVQLLDGHFAQNFREIVSNFSLGMTTGSIVGLARERTPADIWHSDTIERNYADKNSLHQGIRRIVEKEDGIPVFVHSIKIVGNISPALAYTLKGSPIEIRQMLQRYNSIQKQILEQISKGRPEVTGTRQEKSYSAGEGYKSENRLHSIRNRLDALTVR